MCTGVAENQHDLLDAVSEVPEIVLQEYTLCTKTFSLLAQLPNQNFLSELFIT